MLAFAQILVRQLVHAGDELHNPPQRTHVLHQAGLFEKIREVELGGDNFLLHFLHIRQIHRFCGFLDEGEHVSHAQNSRGHAIGIKRLQGFDFFPDPDKFNWRAGNLPHGQGCPPSAVAVHFGENRPGNTNFFVEGPGEIGGFLPGHGINHEQGIVGFDGGFNLDQLRHHIAIDLQATGRIDNYRIDTFGFCACYPLASNFHRVGIDSHFKDGDFDLLAEGFELVDGRWPVNIGGHKQGSTILLAQVQGEFCGGGGFTSSLQTGHQNDGGGGVGLGEGNVGFPHHLHEFVVDDFDKLLVGFDPRNDFGPLRFGFDLGDKFLDDLKVDISTQKSAAHLLESRLDIGFGDFVLTPEFFPGIFESFCKCVKHEFGGDVGRKLRLL